MRNYNLFSNKEKQLIQAVVSSRTRNICVYMLEYKDGLTVCGFIELVFENNVPIIITTGKSADNIILLDEPDFLKEKEKYNIQDDVEIKMHKLNNYDEIIGEKLIGLELVEKPEEAYYCQLNLVFENSTLHIEALIDELAYSIVN